MRGKGKEGDLIDLDQEESWGEVFLRRLVNRLSRNGTIYNILFRGTWNLLKNYEGNCNQISDITYICNFWNERNIYVKETYLMRECIVKRRILKIIVDKIWKWTLHISSFI